MRPRRHTRLIAALAAVTVGLTVAVSTAQGGGDDFVLGSGDTKAEFLKVGPTTASLNAGIIVGQVLADYQNGVARAQSRAIDLTVYATSLVAEKCAPYLEGALGPNPISDGMGADPSLHHDDLPTTLRVDSREEGSEEGQTAYWPILPRDLPYQFDGAKEENGGFPNLDPGHDSPFRVDTSRLYVEADGTPHSHASADTAVTRVGGVADAVGGRVETTAELDGDRRVARSVADIPKIVLGEGEVILRDLHWEAVQTTGPDAPADFEMSGGFTMGSVEVGGVTYTWPEGSGEEANTQTTRLLEVVNAALLPSGLRLEWPQLDQQLQHVTVSPLTIVVDRPPVGAALFDFLPPQVYEAREQLIDAVIEAECNLASFITLGDIFLAVPAGAGHLEVSFGGARAFTEGTEFADPFATQPRLPVGDVQLPGGALDSSGDTGAAVAGSQVGVDETVTDTPVPAPAPSGPVTGPGVQPIGGSKTGAAAVVGLFGLLAVLGVALLDFLRPRRALASLDTEPTDE